MSKHPSCLLIFPGKPLECFSRPDLPNDHPDFFKDSHGDDEPWQTKNNPHLITEKHFNGLVYDLNIPKDKGEL